MSERGRPNRPVKSVEKTFSIVETLQELERAGVSELADALDMSVSAVHAHLDTLEHMDYVVKEDGSYRLGFRFLDHGMFVRSAYTIDGLVSPTLEEITAETGLVSWFSIIEHGWGVYVDVATAESAVRIRARPGYRYEPHSTSSGKAILAQLSEEQVRDVVEFHGLTRKTSNTIGSLDALFDELADVREQGYAISQGESIEGLTGIATPLVCEDEVYGAIAVSGPTNELSDDRLEGAIGLLQTHANNIQLELRRESASSPPDVTPLNRTSLDSPS